MSLRECAQCDKNASLFDIEARRFRDFGWIFGASETAIEDSKNVLRPQKYLNVAIRQSGPKRSKLEAHVGEGSRLAVRIRIQYGDSLVRQALL